MAVMFQIMFNARPGLSGRLCKGIGSFEVLVVFRVASALVDYGWSQLGLFTETLRLAGSSAGEN